MQSIEFETTIENGGITIPSKYRQMFVNHLQVKVIVLKPEPAGNKQNLLEADEEDIIGELLNSPLEIDDFTPLSRDELYDR